MNFRSDTEAPAHPRVLEALAAVNSRAARSYGADAETEAVRRLLGEIFETDLSVRLVAGGTAANGVALATLCGPLGAVLCHREAHIERDERGAPAFFTGGATLQLLDGPHAKIDLGALEAALAARDPDFVHETPAEALSLTNLTESGAAYTPEETAARSAPARAAGLTVHLDGARLANAVAGGAGSPADLTWRAGVDAVCLGLTKTGALGCEAVILFGDAGRRSAQLEAHAKRAGHMLAKGRFLAAQARALLADGLWLELAGRANAAAARLAAGLAALPGVTLAHPVAGNEVFAIMPDAMATALEAAGAGFYPWPDGSRRFVASWSSTPADADAVVAAAQAALPAAQASA